MFVSLFILGSCADEFLVTSILPLIFKIKIHVLCLLLTIVQHALSVVHIVSPGPGNSKEAGRVGSDSEDSAGHEDTV